MNNPKKISETVVAENPFLKILKRDFIDEKMQKSSFLITTHNRQKSIGTLILAVTEDRKILCLDEYRYGPETIVKGFPMWMLDDGMNELENCQKELLEETGYISDSWYHLGESIIENYFAGSIQYYIALNCRKAQEQTLELGENIQISEVSVEDFEQMILDGHIGSSKSCYAFFLAKHKKYLPFVG